MIFNSGNLSENLKKGIRALEQNGFLKTGGQGTVIRAEKGSSLVIEKSEGEVVITYDTEPHFYMALVRSLGVPCGTYFIELRLKELGLMLDCSRNAVAKPEMVKRLICLLVLTGYNYLEMYTEETYELPGEPYFGYKRGRYTAEEFTEIIDFAGIFSFEIVPCIQTLAHLRNLANWKPYFDHMDIDDILMVGDERTYALVKKMLTYCKKIFRAKRINIGMDEAFHLGRGKYTDINGYRSSHEIYLEHIKRIFELCRELDLKPEFWADGFYDTELPKEEVRSVFDGSQTPIYWDYYSVDKDFHRKRMEKLKEYAGKVMYAGGLWTWIGYAPNNAFSDRVHEAALPEAIKCGVDNVLMTVWGDNGGECSVYAIIPAMWRVTELLYPICEGNVQLDKNIILKELTGYTDREWRKCDALNTVMPNLDKMSNAGKYLLHNDFLIGLMDANIPDHAGDIYRQLLPEFHKLAGRNSSFVYIFKVYEAICQVLVNKATYSKRLYAAYQNQDTETMELMKEELTVIKRNLRIFYDAMRALWMKENKGFGFEVLDVRIGGLISRIDTVKAVLEDYLTGRMERIYELEEDRIEYFCGQSLGDEIYAPLHNHWASQYTVNHI